MNKILIISALDIWSMGKNKGAPSLWRTLKGYADNEWKVFFITGNKDKNSIYNVHRNIEIIRFDFPELKTFFNIKKVGFIANSIWWLFFQIKSFLVGFRIAKKEKIDIFYGYETLGILVSYILGKIFKKPTISRFQGIWDLIFYINTFLGRWKHFQVMIGLKIPTNLLIMTNDGTEGDKVLKALNINMSKVKFWVNGIDKKLFDPNFNKEKFKENLGISKNKKILLAVSRLVRGKRVDRTIKAMPEVVKGYSDVELLVIGDGGERKKLENLAEELEVEGYIKFLGALPHQDLKNYYNLADIFISMYNVSNVGNPLLEAMSYGKCIITLDVGDTNKFIHNGENGILLKSDKLERLPYTIIDLLKNDKKRKLFGKKAREFADKNFWTWEERIGAEISAVSNLLKDNGK